MDLWPPVDLPGLTVDFGQYDPQAARWVRPPTGRYRCACGFARAATGARDVAALTAVSVAEHHAACSRHRPRKERP